MVEQAQRLRLALTALGIAGACHAASPATAPSASPAHRPASASCAPHRGNAEGGGPPPSCAADADCRDAPHGFCEMSHIQKGLHAPRCSYDECLDDAECGARGACRCRDDLPHVCVPGDCKIDADCPAPHFCAYSPGQDVLTQSMRTTIDRGFYCRTSRDRCADDRDCLGQRCGFVAERRRWECRESVD